MLGVSLLVLGCQIGKDDETGTGNPAGDGDADGGDGDRARGDAGDGDAVMGSDAGDGDGDGDGSGDLDGGTDGDARFEERGLPFTEPGEATDSCPGWPLQLDDDGRATVWSATTTLAGDHASYCGAGTDDGADAVYTLTPPAAGTLTVALESGAGFDGVLYLQDSCDDDRAILACGSPDELGARLSVAAQQDVPLFVVVDGRGDSDGEYVLDVRLSEPRCGDRIVNAGEQCDFGDDAPGDGCDAQCQFELPDPGFDVCPGSTFGLSADAPQKLGGFTVGYGDDYQPRCIATTGGADRVFAFNPASSGTLDATLTADFDAVLAIYERCSVPTPGDERLLGELACADGPAPRDPESLSIAVEGGAQYFVVVDGFDADAAGAFELEVALSP